MAKALGRWGVVSLVLLALSGSASGQDYPTKPIRLVVPYPAGGVVDFVAADRSENGRLDVTIDRRGKSSRGRRNDCDGNDGKVCARWLYSYGRLRHARR